MYGQYLLEIFMCQRTTCNTCNKPSWTGCGAHVEQILGDVAIDDRCSCGSEPGSAGPGLLQRVFGKS